MELDDAIRSRRMCRRFSDRPVERDVVASLLERTRWAPSAGHTQGWEWLVLDGADRSVLWRHEDAGRAPAGVAGAPVLMIPLASAAPYLERYSRADKAGLGRQHLEGWPVPYWLVDASFAVMLLLLAATAEGLGALLFALHGDEQTLLADLGVPPGWKALGAVALGWPAPGAGDRPRRPMRPAAEATHWGRW